MARFELLALTAFAAFLLQSFFLCGVSGDNTTILEFGQIRLLGRRLWVDPSMRRGQKHMDVRCCQMDPLWRAAKNKVLKIAVPTGKRGKPITYNVQAMSRHADAGGVKIFNVWVPGTYTWKGQVKSFPKLEIKSWPKRKNPRNPKRRCSRRCLYRIAFTETQSAKIRSMNTVRPTTRPPTTRRLSEDCSKEACGLVLGVGVTACLTACVLSGPFYLVCAEACVAFISPGLGCCIAAFMPPAGGCFPGSETVHVSGLGRVRMDQLRIGDRVRTIDAKGKSVYEEVYLFGHRDPDTIARFQHLTTDRSNLSLTLTDFHYVPRAPGPLPNQSPSWPLHELVYARALSVGDTIWVWDPLLSSHVPALITSKTQVLQQGLFNPLTLGSRIEVDGTIASCHSNWFLDGRVPESAQRYLPAVYQAVLAPVRLCYPILGAERMAALDAKFKFAEAGAEGTLAAYARAFWMSAINGFSTR